MLSADDIKIVFEEVNESRKFTLAGWSLLALSTIMVLSGIAFYFYSGTGPDKGKYIFDKAILVVPPLVTLILGFYFSKSSE